MDFLKFAKNHSKKQGGGFDAYVWESIPGDYKICDGKIGEKVDVEKVFYESLLPKIRFELLDASIKSVCREYIEYFSSNSGKKIVLDKKNYKMFPVNEKHNSMTCKKRDLPLIQHFLKINEEDERAFLSFEKDPQDLYKLLGWKFLKIVLERKYGKYVSFLKKNINKKTVIEKQKSYLLYVDETQFIAIPRKDEHYVQKLFKYWNFVKKHLDVKVAKVEVCEKNGKEKTIITGVDIRGEIEAIEIPTSNMDELEIAQKIVCGKGTIGAYEKSFLSNEKAFLEDQFDRMMDTFIEGNGLLASQLQCFFSNEIGLFSGDNTAINSRLSSLEVLSVVQKESRDGKKGKVAENIWKLKGITISDLLQNINEAKSDIESDFETAFHTALDFFSRYYVLGVCGTFIKDRMDRLGTRNKSPFRFRHEYFMQSLNDFNLIDLLYVIENQKWCEIQYRHGTADFSSILLCKPLEIRISSTTGREFLVFYNPVKRSCTNLRLEFIEEITAYDEEDVLKALKGEKISKKEIASDIANACDSLKYMWGVSFSMEQEENVVLPVKPQEVRLTISYDRDAEYYIKNRIIRESRSTTGQMGISIQPEKGLIVFGAYVSDSKEMRPWVRSFYSRILRAEGVESGDFSLLDDLQKCILGMEELHKEVLPEPKRWTGDTATLGRIGKGEKVRKHEEIFNEMFGVYYYIISEVILLCCSADIGKTVSWEYIHDVVKKVRNWYKNQEGLLTSRLSVGDINWLLENDSFGKTYERSGKEGVDFKYECSSEMEFYKDVLPLTTLEIRWLKTIISDSKMKCFLSDKQIEYVKSILDDTYPEIIPLPMSAIVYYDRYIVASSEKETERLFITSFTEAINKKLVVDISYITRGGKELVGKFKPIVLEYSNRNNKFQACLQSCDNNRFYVVNIPQINSITIADEEFDYYQALKEYEEYRDNNECSVKLKFYDVRNLADRILTEFSPWKKRCEFDSDTGIYTLEIFYQKADELDLVVRLMGYGSNVHFVEKEHSIAREILSRYTKQRDLIFERQKDVGRGD